MFFRSKFRIDKNSLQKNKKQNFPEKHALNYSFRAKTFVISKIMHLLYNILLDKKGEDFVPQVYVV